MPVSMAANPAQTVTTKTTTTAQIVQKRAKDAVCESPDDDSRRSIGAAPQQGGTYLPTDLTTTAAARVLGCSVSTVIRMSKQGRLRCVVETDGTRRFALGDVEAVRSTLTYTKKTVRTVQSRMLLGSDLVSGDTAAIAFTMFNQGHTPIDVVVGINLPPAAAQRLYQQWQALKGMIVLDASQYRQVMSILQLLDAVEQTATAGDAVPLADDFVQTMIALPTRVVKKDSTLCDVCLMNGVEKPHRAQRCLGHSRKG